MQQSATIANQQQPIIVVLCIYFIHFIYSSPLFPFFHILVPHKSFSILSSYHSISNTTILERKTLLPSLTPQATNDNLTALLHTDSILSALLKHPQLKSQFSKENHPNPIQQSQISTRFIDSISHNNQTTNHEAKQNKIVANNSGSWWTP